MKKYSKGVFILKAIVFGTFVLVVFTFAVMFLWNWLMPAIFGLGIITFWQSLGLMVLSKILFSGGHPTRNWHDREKLKVQKENFSERFRHVHARYHTKMQNVENNEAPEE